MIKVTKQLSIRWRLWQRPARAFLILFMLFSVAGVVSGQQTPTFRNPLNPYNGADPWLTYYEGNYYLATTTWTSELTMRRSPTLVGLKTAIPQRIYTEKDPSRCCNMWAPEFRLLDSPNGRRWYFYYSAGTSGTLDNQHTHVLESAETDPMGPYIYKGRLYHPQQDFWAIDGAVLQLNKSLYFIFSSWVGKNQSLFIAPMSNPWTLSSPGVLIAKPEHSWEQIGGNVNEAPVALYHEGKTFIIYSASSCATPDYKLGILTYAGGEPLTAQAWIKHPEPVFQRSDANGVFGPGHNGFFKSPDGTEDWIIYHAIDSASGGCGGSRTTRAQKFTWNADGTPNFGIPLSIHDQLGAPSGDKDIDPVPDFGKLQVSRFKSRSYSSAYLRHIETAVRVDQVIDPRADSRFFVVPGLADSAAISIVSINLPGNYLFHNGNTLMFGANDGSASFKENATWRIRPGLADASWIAFESYNQPSSFIGKKFGILALVKLTELTTPAAREDATFLEEHENASQR
jgi:GH43 family beta-xylosidase